MGKKKSHAGRKWLVVTLLILGAPVWFPLLVSALAVIWSVVVSLWVAYVSVVTSAFSGVIAGSYLICTGKGLSGLFLIGGALVCAGLGIFLFYGARALTRGSAYLTKVLVTGCGKRREAL